MTSKEREGAKAFFSVVVPLYNKAPFIERTLESIKSQTFEGWEAFVVNDGSTDGGETIAADIAKQDARITVVSQPNAGVSAARNAGIMLCGGEVVCFLDADDLWTPTHLNNIHNLYVRYPSACLYFDQCQVRKNGKVRPDPWFAEQGPSDGILSSYCQAMVVSPNLINSSVASVKRLCLMQEDVLFDVNSSVGEDLELWLRLALKYPTAYSSAVGAIYNRDTKSNARTLNRIHYPGGYFKTIRRALDDRDVSDADKRALTLVRDRKEVAYVFSLIRCGEKTKARDALRAWRPSSKYARLKMALYAAVFLPRAMADMVSSVRERVA